MHLLPNIQRQPDSTGLDRTDATKHFAKVDP